MLNLFELRQKTIPISGKTLEGIGDILQYFLPWSALLAIALIGNSEAAREWLYAGFLTAVVTFLLKWIFNFTWLGRRPNGAPYSFPSGHTSSAFMGAAFFHFQLGFYPAVLPYLLAGLTGYSRIYAGKHWLRDVIAGAALAIGVTYWMSVLGN